MSVPKPSLGFPEPTDASADVHVNVYALGGSLVMALPAEVYDRSMGTLQERVLVEIERRGSRGLVIDLATVDLVDRFLAEAVLDLGRMAALLGARSVVTGVRSEVAAVLATLGFDSGETTFAGSVEDALALLGDER